jgi:hypothetical protein
MTENKRRLRNWRTDIQLVEDFCKINDICFGHIVYDESKYSIFFEDVDGDEIQCCLSINSGDLTDEPLVKQEDIVLIIPLNELDLKTNVCEKLEKYCLENNIIKSI